MLDDLSRLAIHKQVEYIINNLSHGSLSMFKRDLDEWRDAAEYQLDGGAVMPDEDMTVDDYKRMIGMIQ